MFVASNFFYYKYFLDGWSDKLAIDFKIYIYLVEFIACFLGLGVGARVGEFKPRK